MSWKGRGLAAGPAWLICDHHVERLYAARGAGDLALRLGSDRCKHRLRHAGAGDHGIAARLPIDNVVGPRGFRITDLPAGDRLIVEAAALEADMGGAASVARERYRSDAAARGRSRADHTDIGCCRADNGRLYAH